MTLLLERQTVEKVLLPSIILPEDDKCDDDGTERLVLLPSIILLEDDL